MSNEWYTPQEFIEAVKIVFGGKIELDPASCEFAQRTVQAERYYTIQDNALMLSWQASSVFLNPPYGKTNQGAGSNLEKFTSKLVYEYEQGYIQQAILLIPNNTGTSWFPPLWKYLICFPDFRIRFNTESGPSDGAAFASIFVYLGQNTQQFSDVFCRYGTIATAVKRQVGSDIAQSDLWGNFAAA